MKHVLIVAPRLPEHDREGGSHRVFHLIRHLQAAGCFVTYVAGTIDSGERYLHLLSQQGVLVYGEATYRDLPSLLNSMRFDLAILVFWYVGELFTPIIRSSSPQTVIAIESVDLHLLRRARDGFRLNGTLDDAYASEARRELNAYAGADVVFTVSQKEADLINDLLLKSDHAVHVPGTEELARSPVSHAERTGTLLLGNFQHPPNVDAARYLLDEIWPHVSQAVKALHPLSLIGNAMPPALVDRCRCEAHVIAVGWVPSVLPYLYHSRLMIVPLLTGAGTKRKLIQTLMAGTPAVTTSIGAEGLNLVDEKHVLIADDSVRLADGIERLALDDALWHSLADHGRHHILEFRGDQKGRRDIEMLLARIL